jgi:hypothetical protein
MLQICSTLMLTLCLKIPSYNYVFTGRHVWMKYLPSLKGLIYQNFPVIKILSECIWKSMSVLNDRVNLKNRLNIVPKYIYAFLSTTTMVLISYVEAQMKQSYMVFVKGRKQLQSIHPQTHSNNNSQSYEMMKCIL